jgi:hypothetical protein
MRALLATSVLLCSFASFAQVEPAPAAESSPAPAAEATNLPEKSVASAVEPGTRSARKERFQLHREVGFATEAMMLGSLAFYIVDDVQRFGPGSRVMSFGPVSLSLSALAEVGIIINTLLALTAPPRKGNIPTINVVHQILMYSAAAANIVRFVLGVMLAGATAENVDQGLLNAYRVTSIAGPVLFATGFTLKLF